MGTNTAQLRPPGATRLFHQFKQAFKAGSTLDSLKNAYQAAKALCASGNLSLILLAQKAMQAIRKSAATLFGDATTANIFLLGAY
jgi:hypothetical protein